MKPEHESDNKAGGAALRAVGFADDAAVIDLKGVSFGYDSAVPVIRSVTVGLRPGRVCALIGPNAAGKSTLLKLMLGQLEPGSGSVRLGGRGVSDCPTTQRAGLISYVPQQGGVSFAYTVEQVVAMGRYAMGQAGDHDGEVQRALEVCDLSDVAGRVFAELSGGQQQRVLLARAVAQSAGTGRAMLLDEPASGMDLWHVHQTMRLLKDLARGGGDGDGLAVLVVLHDVNLAARYADDVWLMDEGRLESAGAWDVVMKPELLEKVYGVRFTPMSPPDTPQSLGGLGDADRPETGTEIHDRPVFWVDPAGNIE